MAIEAKQAHLAATFFESAASALAGTTDPATAMQSVIKRTNDPEALMAALRAIVESDPDLALVASTITELVRAASASRGLVAAVAGEPESLDEEVAWTPNDPLVVARVQGEGQHQIFTHPLLSASEFGRWLGSGETGARERARALRDRGEVVAVPHGRGYVFPTFQIDRERQRVWPIVIEINELLDARRDPWGAASWWYSFDSRLNSEPFKLVGSKNSDELLTAANLALTPVY